MRYLLVPAALVLLATVGCASMRQTQPPQTATEQLLISQAADDAARDLWLASLQGTSIFISTKHFDSLDEAYAVGAIRAHLVEQGALLVDKRAEADIVVEIRSGALSINKSENLMLGLPSMQLPVPFAATGLKFPEIPLLKRSLRQGIAKFALTAYDARTGAFVGTTGPIIGRSYISHWRFFLIPWTHTDVQPLGNG